MIATYESFDEMITEASRQATRNVTLATNSALRYVEDISSANHSQFAALDAFQQAILRSVFDLQTASFQLSRSVVDAASILNRALVRFAAGAVWPWEPLGTVTEPAVVVAAGQVWHAIPEADYDASQLGDCVMSALRFQGPMGMISSGMGELED